MASGVANTQFGFGGFVKKNPFEISGTNNPTGGQFLFGVPTSQFGTSSFSTSNSSTTSQFGTGPCAFRPAGSNLFTASQFGTSSCTTGQTLNSGTTAPFGQTNNTSTTLPLGPAPFSFPQTSNSCGTAPFSFPQTTNSLTTPSTAFAFTSSMISAPTTSASNVSMFAPLSGTRQKAYEITAFYDEWDQNSYKMLSISAIPFYINKSHEELRFEDYTLTGKSSTTTTTTNVPNSHLVSTSSSNPSIFLPPISSTPIITPTIQPVSQPVITPPQKVDYPFPTSQPISTTGVIQNITVPVTSTPATVSQGDYIPKAGCLTENNPQQQHVYPCLVSPMTNPFGTEVRDTHTLPIKPFQYGISCLPVSQDPKPAPKMPLMNVRQLSMGRRRLPIDKYKPIEDEKRVPFFEELPGIYKKGGAVLIPRENPRSWVVLSCEEQSLETELSELSVSDQSTNLCNNDDCSRVEECVPKMNLSKEIKHGDEDDAVKKNTGAIIDMIPKLRGPEYYMEPSTDDLVANELKMPGFNCKVKDFVIGRRNYGSIKFLGETDVRNLDVESIVQFSNREVVVYKDEKDKPPVGQGLNKAAEITLLNINCIDKSTGMHYKDGPRVDQFKELLMRKAMKQGSEFVSFDPVKGEWRFKVEHF